MHSAVKKCTHHQAEIKLGAMTVKLSRQEWLELLGEMTAAEHVLEEQTTDLHRWRMRFYSREHIGMPA